MKNSLQHFVKESKAINSSFDNKWGIETRIVNLVEELGELSHDILVSEGRKNDKPHWPTISGNLSSLLYEIFLIADIKKVNLDDAWNDFLKIMPEWIEKRNKKLN